LATEPGLHLECEDYPDRFLTLCHWGCSIYSRLDGWTGRIYGTGVGQASDWQYEGDAPWVCILEHQADSLEEWFDLWLRGELRQPFARLTWEAIERERETLIRPLYVDTDDKD
jgi:hypothetical protein